MDKVKENGHITTIEAPQENLTPEQRIAAYTREEAALRERYRVQLVGFIKTYNGGQQVADFDIVPLQ